MQIEIAVAAGWFLLLVSIETLFCWAYKIRTYDLKDTVANISLAVSDLVFAAALKGFFLWLFTLLHKLSLYDFGHSWYGWILLIFVNDFGYYIFHRCAHRCRFMWAFHVTHHSSERYNFSVAIRLNLLIFPLHFIFMLPLAILGFRPEAILLINSLTTLYQLWVHTELIGNLGIIDKIFNTPSNHRVHHGANPQYIDKNYGATFIFWDYIFGSFEPEVEKPNFGLTKNISSNNPFTLTFHEALSMFRDVSKPGSFRNRFMYMFGPPGWKPSEVLEKDTVNVKEKKKAVPKHSLGNATS